MTFKDFFVSAVLCPNMLYLYVEGQYVNWKKLTNYSTMKKESLVLLLIHSYLSNLSLSRV